MRPALLLAALVAIAIASPALAEKSHLLEPGLTIAKGGAKSPQVALTLDACSGALDHRILDVLIAERIPATIFVTKRWLDGNPDGTALMLAHPDLFAFEDHGAAHIPAVIGTEKPYGITPAGTAEAVTAEVLGGAEAIAQRTGAKAQWYRGATALYSPDAIALIGALGFRVAGFSLNGDLGASAPADVAAKRIAGAKDGDVIISHINQPKRASGAGVAEGILALKAKGFRFVLLRDVEAR